MRYITYLFYKLIFFSLPIKIIILPLDFTGHNFAQTMIII